MLESSVGSKGAHGDEDDPAALAEVGLDKDLHGVEVLLQPRRRGLLSEELLCRELLAHAGCETSRGRTSEAETQRGPIHPARVSLSPRPPLSTGQPSKQLHHS